MSISTEQLDELAAAIAGAVTTGEDAVREASADGSPRSKKAVAAGAPLHVADAVASPQDTADVVRIVQWANKHSIPLVARGGGSGVVGSGWPVRGGVVVDVSGLNSIEGIDEVNHLVTVGAGVIGSELEKVLEPHGLAVGHYPQSFSLASVAGWVTMRGSGTFSSLYGNIEERLADLEVVLPDGTVLQTQSVPRASQGPDLKQLFIGSEGTLGIITKVTLRLVPRPDSRIFSSFLFDTFEAALETSRRLLAGGVRPAVLRIYDPIESKAKHASFSDRDGWMMILAFDGHHQLTAVQADIAHGTARALGGESLGAEPGVHWEQRRFDWSWFTDNVSVEGGIAEAIELTTTWSRLPELYAAVTAAAAKSMPVVMGHVSHVYDQGASLYVISSGRFGTDTAAMEAYDQLWADVMQAALEQDARISHHHGIGVERAPWLPDAVGEAGMSTLRAIKDALDPAGVMNPGKLGL